MVIRKYQPYDCKELAELFYNTVHTINAKDYTKEQLDGWAAGFEKRGYKIIKEQQVERNGIFLTNFVMEKEQRFYLKKDI